MNRNELLRDVKHTYITQEFSRCCESCKYGSGEDEDGNTDCMRFYGRMERFYVHPNGICKYWEAIDA